MMNKKTVPGLPPTNPLTSPSNTNGGRATAYETDQPTTDTQAAARVGQDPKMIDQKKLRRIIASRQYSQKYRLKQLHYMMQLETEVKALQAEVAIMAPRIKYVDRQNSLLRAENGSMKQKLSALTGELSFKEAQYEELKDEREALKQIYAYQQRMWLRNQQYRGFPFGSA